MIREKSVGLIIFRYNNRDKEIQYLVLYRRGTYWNFPKGKVDRGESEAETARREVMEETQLKIISEPCLIAAQDIILNKEKHIVRLSYVADTIGEPVLDTSENIEYRWLSFSELKTEPSLDVYVRNILEHNLL